MPVKKKILLVEDDHNFGSILKDYLSLHSYETIVIQRNNLEFIDPDNIRHQ